MVDAAFRAASGEDVQATVLQAEKAGAVALLSADGYIFACPENLGSMSGEMKAFFDRCYYPVLGKIEGRPYAQMVCAGSDGHGTVKQMTRIVTGWRLREVHPPLIVCTKSQTPEDILAPKMLSPNDTRSCADLGQGFAAGLAMGVY